MPTQLLKQPIVPEQIFRKPSSRCWLSIFSILLNQSPVSNPYKLVISIYAVRPFQTPHTLFLSRAILISFISKTLSCISNSFFKEPIWASKCKDAVLLSTSKWLTCPHICDKTFYQFTNSWNTSHWALVEESFTFEGVWWGNMYSLYIALLKICKNSTLYTIHSFYNKVQRIV